MSTMQGLPTARVGLLSLGMLLASGLLLGGQYATAEESGRTRIRAEYIYTAEGDVIAPGEILINDGKISYVGSAIELGLPAREVRVHTLIPGLINAASRAGLSGGEAEVSREITPDFDTYSSIDWRSRSFPESWHEGVTTVQVLPDTDSVFCGYACIVKTAGPSIEKRSLKRQASVLMAVCRDPTSGNRSRTRPDSIYVRQPTNRMGVVWIVRNTLHRVKTAQVATSEELGLDPNAIKVLSSMLDGSLPVSCVSRTDFDIRSALELGEQHGYQPTIIGGDEVYRMMEEFQQSGASLVYTALTTTSSSRGLRGAEGTDLRWNIPGKLEKAEVEFCLAGDRLLEQAQFAVRFGLSEQSALAAITLRPAQILNIDDQVGSIRVGKQADLVALSGPPHQPTSSVQWTMIDGHIYPPDEGE